MASLLTTDDFEQVRKSLDVDLTVTSLPDSIISMSIYQAAAIADVLAIYSSAESETGADFQRCKRAAIYFCAARLAPAVVRLTSITTQARDLNISKPAFDPETRAAELRAMAQSELSEVVTPDQQAATRPTMFALATGTRGR